MAACLFSFLGRLSTSQQLGAVAARERARADLAAQASSVAKAAVDETRLRAAHALAHAQRVKRLSTAFQRWRLEASSAAWHARESDARLRTIAALVDKQRVRRCVDAFRSWRMWAFYSQNLRERAELQLLGRLRRSRLQGALRVWTAFTRSRSMQSQSTLTAAGKCAEAEAAAAFESQRSSEAVADAATATAAARTMAARIAFHWLEHRVVERRVGGCFRRWAMACLVQRVRDQQQRHAQLQLQEAQRREEDVARSSVLVSVGPQGQASPVHPPVPSSPSAVEARNVIVYDDMEQLSFENHRLSLVAREQAEQIETLMRENESLRNLHKSLVARLL